MIMLRVVRSKWILRIVATLMWIGLAACGRARVDARRKEVDALARAYADAKVARDRTKTLFEAIDHRLILGAGFTYHGGSIEPARQIIGKDNLRRWSDYPWREFDAAMGPPNPEAWYTADLVEDDPGRANHDPWNLVARFYVNSGNVEGIRLCNCVYNMTHHELWRPGAERPVRYDPAATASREREPLPGAEQRILELTHAYVSAKTGSERRSVAVAAIDEGFIYEGGPVAVVDRIFGGPCDKKRPAAEPELCRVEFLPYHWREREGSRDDLSKRDWELRVVYDAGGRISCYSLLDVPRQH